MHNNASMPYMSLIIRRKWNHSAVRQARPFGQYVDLPRVKNSRANYSLKTKVSIHNLSALVK